MNNRWYVIEEAEMVVNSCSCVVLTDCSHTGNGADGDARYSAWWKPWIGFLNNLRCMNWFSRISYNGGDNGGVGCAVCGRVGCAVCGHVGYVSWGSGFWRDASWWNVLSSTQKYWQKDQKGLKGKIIQRFLKRLTNLCSCDAHRN